jgi:hypothetical protein
MRVQHRILAVVVLSVAIPWSVGAQQDPIPRELALALIPYGGSDGGEIIVGQIPTDLATTFTLPAGGRVLGSFVSLTYMQVVMTLPGGLDSADAFARRSLASHGWVARALPSIRMGGLQYGSPRSARPSVYCKPGASDAITISTQFHGQTTLLRLTRNTGSGICDETRLSGGAITSFSTSASGGLVAQRIEPLDPRLAQMPIASVPPLWSPGDPRASQVCRPRGAMGAETQSQPLRTELSPQEILAHYGRQLDSAGWKPMNSDASSVAGTWTNATNGQEVMITVTKVPTQAGCYDISLRATARQSTK